MPYFSLSDPSNPELQDQNHCTRRKHSGKDRECIGASSKKRTMPGKTCYLGALLEANFPELKVIYTRDSDEFIELNERANIANRNNADLFVCVHCNAVSRASISGAEPMCLDCTKWRTILKWQNGKTPPFTWRMIMKKNTLDMILIARRHIFSVAPGKAPIWNKVFCWLNMCNGLLILRQRDDRGVKQAGFLVLKETAMPSVLIETGYLTNATEEQYLASSEGQEEMALAIFKAIRAYKNHMEYGQNSVAAVSNSYVKPVSRKIVVNSTTTSSSKGPGTTAKTEKKQVPSKSPYRIYLLSWSNKLDPNAGQLGLLSDVHEVNEGGKYHYYFGNYSSMEEAEKILPEIRNLGFKTAKIVQ
ncbi:MAG: N-acetylmuramoyl-L-alanine amidase [Saprospiraceae bacterium]